MKNGCVIRLTPEALEKILGLPEGVIHSIQVDAITDNAYIKIRTKEPTVLDSDFGSIRTYNIPENAEYRMCYLQLPRRKSPIEVLKYEKDGNTYLGIPGKVNIKEVVDEKI